MEVASIWSTHHCQKFCAMTSLRRMSFKILKQSWKIPRDDRVILYLMPTETFSMSIVRQKQFRSLIHQPPWFEHSKHPSKFPAPSGNSHSEQWQSMEKEAFIFPISKPIRYSRLAAITNVCGTKRGSARRVIFFSFIKELFSSVKTLFRGFSSPIGTLEPKFVSLVKGVSGRGSWIHPFPSFLTKRGFFISILSIAGFRHSIFMENMF